MYLFLRSYIVHIAAPSEISMIVDHVFFLIETFLKTGYNRIEIEFQNAMLKGERNVCNPRQQP